jgi:hypothetical protein
MLAEQAALGRPEVRTRQALAERVLAPPDAHGERNKKAVPLRGRLFELVAGAGFEPTTFRL